MRRIFVLSIVVAIGVLCCQASGDSAEHRSRNRRNAFILRKCIATAELRRRTGPHGVGNPISKQESEETAMKSLPPSATVDEDTAVDSDRERIAFKAREGEAKVEKHVNFLKNTPLTTVDIKTLKNRSPIFRKKSLLPELERSISSRTVGPSQNIILIKPVK